MFRFSQVRKPFAKKAGAITAALALVAGVSIGHIAFQSSEPAQAAMEQPGTTSLTLTGVEGRMGSVNVNNSQEGRDYGYADCVRYSTANGYSVTTNGTPQWVPAGSTWSYISRGTPDQYCRQQAQIDSTSALGFKTSNPGNVNAGQTFLVGTIRHNNFPIFTNYAWVHGSIDLTIGGTSEEFPFDQWETPNNNESVAVYSARGSYSSSPTVAPTRNAAGGYTCYYGTYIALVNGNWDCLDYVGVGNGNLDVYSDSNYPNKLGNANQVPNSDDILTIRKTTATKVVISRDGIPYRLVLWGFVPTDGPDSCPAAPPAGSVPVNTFTTKEGKVSYGCLYGSFNQERLLKIQKAAAADANSQNVAIPGFSFSTDLGPNSAQVAGASSDLGDRRGFITSYSYSGPLRPTRLDDEDTTGTYEGVDSTSRYSFLVGRSDFVVTENTPLPTGTATQSGWHLRSMKCVNALGEDVNVVYDQAARSIDFSGVGLAPSAAANEIICTYVNHYEAKSKLTIVKQLENAPAGIQPTRWTLTARGQDAVTNETVIQGITGSTAVTSAVVPSGKYNISESWPTSIGGFFKKSLVCVTSDGQNLNVQTKVGDVVLPDGADVTCTFVNEYRTGSIKISKQLVDPENGYTGGTRKFPISYDCGTYNGTRHAGSVNVAPGETVTVDNLPLEISCRVSESTPAGNLKDSSFKWAEPTYSAASVETKQTDVDTLVVTNTVTRDRGVLNLRKVVSPEADTPTGYIGDTAFPISYTCTLDGQTVATGTENVKNGDVKPVSIPAGASCTVSESIPTVKPGEFTAGFYEWSRNEVVNETVTVGRNATVDSTVTNYYRVATVPLKISKKIEGPGRTAISGYKAPDHEFTVNLTCGDNFSYTVKVKNGATQSVDVPRGISCIVNEENNNANFDESTLEADYDWDRDATRYEDANGRDLSGNAINSGNGNAQAVVVNVTKKSYGGIAVEKKLGPDASALPAGTTFDFHIECNAPAKGKTENFTADIKLGTNQKIWRSGEDSLLPAGTDCTITEKNIVGTSAGLIDDSYVWSGTSWIIQYGREHDGATGNTNSTTITAHASSGNDDHPYPRAVFTNTWERAYGTFGVTKVIDKTKVADLPNLDQVGEQATYVGTWTCRYSNIEYTGGWTRVGSGQAVLTVNKPANAEAPTLNADRTRVNLPVGANCSILEDAPTDQPVPGNDSIYFSTRDAGDAITVARDQHKDVAMTNFVDRYSAGLSLQKNVYGAGAGTGYVAGQDFGFHFRCVSKGGTVHEGDVSVADTETKVVDSNVPAGSSCTITETRLADPVDPYRWDAPTFSVVSNDATKPITDAKTEGKTVTFTLPDDLTSGLTVIANNRNSVHTGTVSVKKIVDSPNKVNGFKDEGEIFPVTLRCIAPGKTDLTTIGTKNIADGGTVTFDVPIGSTDCQVVEGNIAGGLTDGSYSWGAYDVASDVKTSIIEGDNGSFTVTNKIQRVYATVGLEKVVSGQNLPTKTGAGVTFSGTFVCEHPGDANITGKWTVTGTGPASVVAVLADGSEVDLTNANSVLPVGANCTPTEADPSGPPVAGNPSYVWTKSGDSAVIEAAVSTSDRLALMKVTNEVQERSSVVKVTKNVTGEVDGLKDAAHKFTVNATCTDDAGDAFDPRTIDVANGETTRFRRTIPRGWTCVLSESALNQDLLKDSSYSWGTPSFTVTTNGQPVNLSDTNSFVVPADMEELTVTVTNPIKRELGEVKIVKDYGDTAEAGGVKKDAVFTGTYECRYDGQVNATGTWKVTGEGEATLTNADGSEQGKLPLNTSCTMAEDAPSADGLTNISWEWKTPAVEYPEGATAAVIAAKDRPAIAVVTNDVQRVYSKVLVEKTYKGDAAALKAGTKVRVSWQCHDLDDRVLAGVAELNANGEVVSLDGTGDTDLIPAGSSCTISEDTPDPAFLADSSWAWNNPVYSVSTDDQTFEGVTGKWSRNSSRDYTLTMRVTNEPRRLYGSIEIEKLIPASSTATPTNTYGGTWQCVAEDGTAIAGTWTRAGDGRALIAYNNDDGDDQIIAGSSCTIAETVRPERPVANDVSYTWTKAITDVPITVVRATVPVDGLASFKVTNESVRNYGSLSLAKAPIRGASDGVDPNGEYTISYVCTAGDGTEVSGKVVVKAGGDRADTDINIPLGSQCRVVETPPGEDVPSNLLSDKFKWESVVHFEVASVAVAEPGTDGRVANNAFTFVLPGQGTKVDVINTAVPIAQVAKTYVETTQSVDASNVWDGTWNIKYTVKVTNPSTETTLKYALFDVPGVPATVKVNKVTVTNENNAEVFAGVVPQDGVVVIVPDRYTDADGAVVDPRLELEKSGVDTYTVIMNVTDTTGAGFKRPDAKEECKTRNDAGAVDVTNTAFVSSNNEYREDIDCADVPESPTFEVEKTNGSGVADDAAVRNGDGSYTSTYVVKVTNTSTTASALIKEVLDSPKFPATAVITDAKVKEEGAAERPLDKALTSWQLAAAGGKILQGGESRSFTVTITYTVDSLSTGFTETDYVCGATRADGSKTGLVNSVSMEGDKDLTNNEACQKLEPKLKVEKQAPVENGGTSGAPTFSVVYPIVVTNDGALAQNTGILTDVPGFATGLEINEVRVGRDLATIADSTVVAVDNGGYKLTDGILVGAGETATFYIRFNVTLNTKVAGYDPAALVCKEDQPGTYLTGHGLFNQVTADAAKDTDGTTNNIACANVGPRMIKIVKTGTQNNGAVLGGAEFALYNVDPSTAGAQPIADALTVDGTGAVFSSSTLELNKNYWLVETKAPAGHQLMPRPVRFFLSEAADKSTKIELLDSDLGTDMVTVVSAGTEVTNGSGITLDTVAIKVHDVEVGNLPLSGGRGIIPNVLIAAALMGLALIAWRRRSTVR